MSESPAPSPPFDGACRLTDWGVIRASGPDTRSFLQGQLTQDMTAVSASRAALAGYCSPKGRLLSTFVVWQATPDEFLMACSADVLSATLKRLSMFVLRAKCRLSDASAELQMYGLAGPTAQSWLDAADAHRTWARGARDGASLIRLPDAQGHARALLAATAAPELPALDAAAWEWLEVQSAVPRITAATSELFVPQMVNLEVVDGVSFSKGCYPGQEVVARSQYRGAVKRRAYVVDSEAALSAGTEVFDGADATQPAGVVVLAASLPGNRHCALVELKIAAMQSGALHAGSTAGPRLTPQPLPYPLPVGAD